MFDSPVSKIKAGVPVIVLSVFLAEYLTMSIMGDSRLFHSLVDAVVVTTVVAIEQYFFLVQPFRSILQKVKILKGFISICSTCQCVNINGKWEHKSHFIIDSNQLSHSLCPHCAKETMDQLKDMQGPLHTKMSEQTLSYEDRYSTTDKE